MLSKIQKDLFNNTTSPVIKYRLALLLNEDISQECFDNFYTSKWVQMLRDNQNADGGYGRFHSQNSKIKQKYGTTEKAIESMNILGLRRGNELVDKLCLYMEKILNNEIAWPDGYEKNKWYRAAQPIFIISKLSNFTSEDKAYLKNCEKWLEILNEAFKGKEYDSYSTNTISEKLVGCQIHGSYIGLNSVYLIELFANLSRQINKSIQEKYLNWLYSDDVIIQYAGVKLRDFSSIDINILYRLLFHISKFECYDDIFAAGIKQLATKYCMDGLWNFGNAFSVQKLSDTWRNEKTKIYDHSVLAWVAKLS